MCDDIKRAEIEQVDRAYGAAVDNCIKDFFIKTGSGFGIGGAVSLLFAKNKRWPLILGAGVGMGLSVSACQAAMRNASLSCGELPPVDGNCYEECEPSAAESDPCNSCDEPSLASPCEPKNVNLLTTEEVPSLIPQEAVQTFMEKADLPTAAEITTEAPVLSEIAEQFIQEAPVTEDAQVAEEEPAAAEEVKPEGSQEASEVENVLEEAPLEVVETPVEVVETPVEVAEAPVEVVEAPLEVEEAPVEVAEAPVEVTEAPVEVAEAPVEVVEAPVEVVEAPVEDAVEVVEVVSEAAEELAPVVEEAVNTDDGSVVAEAAVFEEKVEQQIADKIVEVAHEVETSDESEKVDL